ncbi:non-hemolytic enterotoxin lytic component L1 [Taibaiella sp. KBW10]|uniref:alpha-pore-forming cytotoxin MakA n=1 Tax=Taibaiella sp. KBW10 TaxID=2153357 RepID=UPI000F5B2CC3|nr:HBL/NHE enterotoxin family protein [Taibaiella sp. KBW10]RQO32565.1 non-hemolytic enterotoxin lytic component L1 [Taibaiella sp. KBW10]
MKAKFSSQPMRKRAFALSENNNGDDVPVDKKVQTGFLSMQVVTASCHSVLNTQFVPFTPKPKWFDDLNAKLDAAKVVAGVWINDLAPKLTASIPNQIIDYATTYDAMTTQILALVDKDPMARGKDNPIVQQTFALIDALSNEVDKIIKNVVAMEDKLKNWGKDMQKAHDELSSGTTNIQNLEIELQSDIDKMNNAITNLRTQIDGENKAIAISAGAIGVGVFIGVIGIALAPVTGGQSLWATGAAAVVVVGGAVTWGIMQSKINGQFDEIAKNQQKIADEKRQIVALKGLEMSSSSAITSMANGLQALSDVRTQWQVFAGELQGVKDKLESADEKLYAIVNKGYVEAAQKEWKIALAFAQQLVGMVTPNVESKTLPMSAKVA